MQDQQYLKYRSFTLRICASALYLSEDIYPPREVHGNSENGHSSKSDLLVSMLKNLSEKLKYHHETVIQNDVNYKTLESCIHGPDRSRLTLYVIGQHVDLLVHLVNAVLETQKINQGGDIKEPLEKACTLLSKMTENTIETCQSDPTKSILHREKDLETIVNLLEVKKYSLLNFFKVTFSSQFFFWYIIMQLKFVSFKTSQFSF